MYNQSENPRVKLSLDDLSQALLLLLEEKDLEEITVQALCKKAGTCTKTFYRNCLQSADLIDYQCDQKIGKLLCQVDWQSQDGYALYMGFFDYWEKEKSFLSLLKKRGLFSRFRERLMISLETSSYPTLENYLALNDNDEMLRLYHHAYNAGGLCAMLECWIFFDFTIPADTLCKTVMSMLEMEKYLTANPETS